MQPCCECFQAFEKCAYHQTHTQGGLVPIFSGYTQSLWQGCEIKYIAHDVLSSGLMTANTIGSVGFGGHGAVRPKERREVTLVHAPDLQPDLDEGYVDVGQQPLGVLHPAQDYGLVRRHPGGILAQVCKMGGAHLRHGGERGEGDRLLQMGLDIGEHASQFVRREPAGRRALGEPPGGIAAQDVAHERFGQGHGVELPRDVLDGDRGLQHQRDVLEEEVVEG